MKKGDRYQILGTCPSDKHIVLKGEKGLTVCGKAQEGEAVPPGVEELVTIKPVEGSTDYEVTDVTRVGPVKAGNPRYRAGWDAIFSRPAGEEEELLN